MNLENYLANPTAIHEENTEPRNLRLQRELSQSDRVHLQRTIANILCNVRY